MILSRLLLAISLLFQASFVIAQPSTERDYLATYLQKHKLYGLYADLLEIELSNAANETQQTKLAAELAQLYAWEINANPENYEALNQQLDALLEKFPSAIPVTTQTSIAFGRYRRAKSWFEAWVWERDNAKLKEKVIVGFDSVLQRALGAITKAQKKLATTTLELQAQKDLEAAQAQFQYLAAWSRYYQSIASDDNAQRRQLLISAESDFLQLLEVNDSKSLLDLSPQWWALDSEWTCRLLLGLGMVSQAMAKDRQAKFCFTLLKDPKVPNEIRLNQRVWQFHSYLFPAQLESANTMVNQWEWNAEASTDIPFWSSVAIAGISWSPPNPETINMTRAGLKGLAKANEFQLLDELHAEFPDVRVVGDDFFALWMDGYASLKQAQAANRLPAVKRKADLIADALANLRLALETESQIDPVFRARCGYQFGFALYLAEQYETAASQFREAATLLQPFDSRLASHASWMRCQALERLAAADLRWSESLVFALNEFQKQYPNSERVSQAAFLQITHRLNQNPGEDTLDALKSIRRDDPNYQRALFEICRANHRLWNAADSAVKKNEWAQATLKAAEFYLSETNSPAENPNLATQYIRICLLGADVALQQDVRQAQAWLQRCVAWLPNVSGDIELESDYHFLEMNIAAIQSEKQIETAAAEWLIANTNNRGHRRGALIARARLLDQSRENSSQRATTATRIKLIEAYQQLLELDEPDDSQLKEDAIMRTALFRFAQLQLESQQFAKAADAFARLHRIRPDQLPYLEGLATAEMKRGETENAAKHWRVIIAAFSPDSEIWLNAKYNLILCLQENQPATAQAIYQQVRVLVPELPPAWKARFDRLPFSLPDLP